MDDKIPHRFVFLFGLLFGGSLVFLSPPYSAPDEFVHFCRAYHCSQGKLYACKRDGQTGDDLPASLSESYVAIADRAGNDKQFAISRAKIDKAARIALDPQRLEFTDFSNTALYSPVPYLPQSAVIWAARLWQPAPLTLLYLARLANLIAYLFLAAAAVRLVPIHKWTMALVALLPMSVYLAAAVSADAVTLGLSLLIVASILKLAAGGEKPTHRSLLALGLLLVLLALSKQAYVGLSLLFLAIPGKKFSCSGRRWLLAALLIGLPLAIDAGWTYSVRGLYVPMFPFVDPQTQCHWIFGHPGRFASLVGTELCRWDTYSLMIGVFGWMGPHLPHWIRATYWAALGLAAVLDGGKPSPLSLHTKTVALGTYLFTFAVMATFVYLSWDRVGQPLIEGIQPRYLLPIIPLLLLLPRGGPKLIASRFAQAAVPVIAMLIVVLTAGAAWWTLVKRYYM